MHQILKNVPRSTISAIYWYLVHLHAQGLYWFKVYFFSSNSCYKESQLQVKALQRTMKGKVRFWSLNQYKMLVLILAIKKRVFFILLYCIVLVKKNFDNVMKKCNIFPAQQVHVSRRNEVCFKFAQWRLTGDDGQLGITDLMLRNFV